MAAHMQKIAFLILAHDQPDHLEKLIKSLALPADFYVHVDAKSDLRGFRHIADADNVVLLEDRLRVTWGGFSIVHATLALMRACMQSEHRYAKISLLSGACYPVKPPNAIYEQLARDPDFNFITYANIALCDRFFQNRVTKRWNMDFELPWIDQGGSPSFPTKAVKKALRILQPANPLNARPGFLKNGVFLGSQWWSLSYDCVKFILETVGANREISDYFRHAYAPDEIFFHSIVANSPFAHLTLGERDVSGHRIARPQDLHAVIAALASLHYIDPNWAKTFDIGDLGSLISSDALFTRKLRSPVSDELRDALDQYFLLDGLETAEGLSIDTP